YLAGGAVNNGGIVVEWFLKSLGKVEAEYSSNTGINPYKLIDRMAASSPPGANGLVALPFLLGGERFPIRNPDAKALFYGVQFRHKNNDFLRALLEGVIFTLKSVFDALKEKGLNAKAAYIGGSGATISTWQQIIADVFELPILRQDAVEATLLGDYISYSEAHGLTPELPEPKVVATPSEANIRIYKENYTLFEKLIKLFYTKTP
ncbi:MAG: FGGY-family carbohydrate kinase, partial [Infirmifilum sp.]